VDPLDKKKLILRHMNRHFKDGADSNGSFGASCSGTSSFATASRAHSRRTESNGSFNGSSSPALMACRSTIRCNRCREDASSRAS
jgi:hypothetical protein